MTLWVLNGPLRVPNGPLRGPNWPLRGPNASSWGPNEPLEGPNRPWQGSNVPWWTPPRVYAGGCIDIIGCPIGNNQSQRCGLGFNQLEQIDNGHIFVRESVYLSVNGDSGESVNTILLYQPTVAPTYIP